LRGYKNEEQGKISLIKERLKLFYVQALWQNCEKRLLASSCPSLRMKELGTHWAYFDEI
jgi:hypothetical protein